MPLGPFNMFYGFGASPILVDGMLILPVDQDTGSVPARASTRRPASSATSRSPRRISGYSTPTVYAPKDGGKQMLIPESFQLSAYDVRTASRCGGCAASPAR